MNYIKVKDDKYINHLFRMIQRKKISVTVRINNRIINSMICSQNQKLLFVGVLESKNIKVLFEYKENLFYFRTNVDANSFFTLPKHLILLTRRALPRYLIDEPIFLYYQNMSFKVVDININGLLFEAQNFEETDITAYIEIDNHKIYFDGVIRPSNSNIYGVHFVSIENLNKNYIHDYIFKKKYPYLT
jgi:hypothetical protein